MGTSEMEELKCGSLGEFGHVRLKSRLVKLACFIICGFVKHESLFKSFHHLVSCYMLLSGVNTITRFILTVIPLKWTFHDLGLESEIIPCHSLQLPMFSPALSGSRPVCRRASASLCTSGRANVNWRSREPRSAASRRSSEQTAGTERVWPASCLGDGGSD